MLCEWDCFAKALLFFADHVSTDQAFFPVDDELLPDVKKRCQSQRDQIRKLVPFGKTRHPIRHDPDDVVKDVTDEGVSERGCLKLPCVLAVCGSAFVLLQVTLVFRLAHRIMNVFSFSVTLIFIVTNELFLGEPGEGTIHFSDKV